MCLCILSVGIHSLCLVDLRAHLDFTARGEHLILISLFNS